MSVPVDPAAFRGEWWRTEQRRVLETSANGWLVVALVTGSLSFFDPYVGPLTTVSAWCWLVRQIELGEGRALTGGERLVVAQHPYLSLAWAGVRRPRQVAVMAGAVFLIAIVAAALTEA